MNFVIYGDINIGKTTVVEETIKKLRDNSIECAGFYTKSDSFSRLLLISAGLDCIKVLASPKNEYSNAIRVGKYWFNPQAINFGIDLMESDKKFLIVDEVGRLERRKKGFFPVFEKINQGSYTGFLISVRKEFLDFFRKQIEEEIEKLEVKKSNREYLPNYISSKVNKYL